MVRINADEAARQLDALLERVRKEGESFELARGDEVVARLVPAPSERGGRDFDAVALTELFRQLPDLGDDAEAFAQDVESVRKSLLPLRDPWQE